MFTHAKSSYRDLKAMHYMLRSMLPTSYFIYSFVGCVNYVLFLYGMTMSEVPGSFLTSVIGWIAYCTASWLFSQYLVKTDWQSKKLHNAALVGHLIVTVLLVIYLF
jgi:uncharacterized membrane protein YeaQ/YmgE (transglycosylase-associated protein family)